MPDAVGLACLVLSFLFFRYTFLLVYLVACLDCTLASARCLVSLVRASLNLALHDCLLSFTSSTCFTPFLCWARLCSYQPLLVLSASGVGVAGLMMYHLWWFALGEAEKLTPQQGPCTLRASLYTVHFFLGSGEA